MGSGIAPFGNLPKPRIPTFHHAETDFLDTHKKVRISSFISPCCVRFAGFPDTARAKPLHTRVGIHEMIRMIQFVAVALILTLASCDSNDSSSWNEELSDSWNEEPSEPCEAVGHASHGVGSTWTTLRIWNASGPTLPECEEECETIAAEFVHAIYTCMTACEVRGNTTIITTTLQKAWWAGQRIAGATW